MPYILIENISKSFYKNGIKAFGTVEALKNIGFEVEKGEIFGVIGPDGAGKTTLYRILTTLLLPDSGFVKIGDMDVVKDYMEIRKRIGYMPGKFSLYQDLTVQENINFFAAVFDTTFKKNYDLIKDIYVQIEPFKKRRAGQLSGGMKQKLALCCALIHKPDVLFLDEPTTGVDPVSRKEFWEMLGRLKKEGITIIVSTPYMDEAEKCERLMFMLKGEKLIIDTPKGLVNGFNQELWAFESENLIHLLDILKEMKEVETCFSFGDAIHVTFFEQKIDIEKIKNQLQNFGFNNMHINKIKPSIEDRFIGLSK
jgi:ABC-type multidrug transport system ATPase subunit